MKEIPGADLFQTVQTKLSVAEQLVVARAQNLYTEIRHELVTINPQEEPSEAIIYAMFEDTNKAVLETYTGLLRVVASQLQPYQPSSYQEESF